MIPLHWLYMRKIVSNVTEAPHWYMTVMFEQLIDIMGSYRIVTEKKVLEFMNRCIRDYSGLDGLSDSGSVSAANCS